MPNSDPRLELRFTGGWVRDKLLGVKSEDIDVALSTMTGSKFVEQLAKFVTEHGSRYEAEASKLGVKEAQLRGLHHIAANPEKSKHLETATTKMFGFDIDYVNLRKEEYAENSRNPQMEFGTPEDDALRRDATVNAIFYNLDTEQIEDFTGRGLEDMERKVMRTPLAPYKTFKDDPLRVLRLIRLASRLGYEIDPDAKRAMMEPSILAALRAKISRERVGTEVRKMLSGPEPHRALTFVNDLDLYSTVFANPGEDFCPDIRGCVRVYDGLRDILSDHQNLTVVLKMKEDPTLCWLLAAYAPWATTGPKAVAAAHEGIKATNKECKVLGDAVQNRGQLLPVLDRVQRNEASRADVGMCIRRLGTSWRMQVLYSILCDLNGTDQPFEIVVDRYTTFLNYVETQDLLGSAEISHVLKADKIGLAFGAKSGPWMKRALDMVMKWQLQHPNGSQEDAMAMIAGRKAELGLG